MSSQHPWLAAVIISVESEYWSKLNYNMNTLNQFWVDLNSSRRIEGLSWPSLNIDELRKKEGLREKELLELMARENIILSSVSKVGVNIQTLLDNFCILLEKPYLLLSVRMIAIQSRHFSNVIFMVVHCSLNG